MISSFRKAIKLEKIIEEEKWNIPLISIAVRIKIYI
jgi:hypothetical protein